MAKFTSHHDSNLHEQISRSSLFFIFKIRWAVNKALPALEFQLWEGTLCFCTLSVLRLGLNTKLAVRTASQLEISTSDTSLLAYR